LEFSPDWLGAVSGALACCAVMVRRRMMMADR
jgi:hypothetical protein